MPDFRIPKTHELIVNKHPSRSYSGQIPSSPALAGACAPRSVRFQARWRPILPDRGLQHRASHFSINHIISLKAKEQRCWSSVFHFCNHNTDERSDLPILSLRLHQNCICCFSVISCSVCLLVFTVMKLNRTPSTKNWSLDVRSVAIYYEMCWRTCTFHKFDYP